MDAVASGVVVAAVALLVPLRSRFLLSRAKHPSIHGHARLARRLARMIPFYEYNEGRFFDSDGAPTSVAERRRHGFARLRQLFQAGAPETIRATEALEASVPDLQFTRAYRVPFQYSRYANLHLKVGAMLQASSGVRVTDIDGNGFYDLTGSYGVNVFGYDFYKTCVDAGIARVQELGPLLGSYHPVVQDNVDRLRAISGMDEVSFHMSGTEAVMQAVRLARFHTGRSRLVRFCGAYHGWWDDVQPGVGNPRVMRDTYTLKDMSEDTLRVLATRRDIACVLVNPLQALHVNAAAPGDSTLLTSERRAGVDRAAYTAWLRALREVCTRHAIPLIFDEVFVGFRIAYGGAQEYFGIQADMVTYGKTVGGGLPVGVVCGGRHLMKRFHSDHPSDICFARGTFNSHPYVMGAMNEFLHRIDDPEIRAAYAAADGLWNARAQSLNERLHGEALPVRVANLGSIWTICYATPSRYNWMLQYYLRAEGLSLSWVGSGRIVFSHNYTDRDFGAVGDRFVAAARAMDDDGWWWKSPSLTDRTIRRQLLRATLAARFGRRP